MKSAWVYKLIKSLPYLLLCTAHIESLKPLEIMLTTYFISGLGADERAFEKLDLDGEIKPVFLNWIPPQENDDLVSYSIRLSGKINKEEPFALVGLSMGGMIAIEIAKLYTPKKLIIISSISNYHSFPKMMKAVGFLHIYQFIPVSWLKSGSMVKRIFMAETPPVKRLIEEMIRDSNGLFIRWALGAVANWKNEVIPQNLVHIHGESDEIFPIKYCNPNYRIPNGTHLMVLTHSLEISSIIKKIFNSK